MAKVNNLEEFKVLKKAKIVEKDLENIIKILTLSSNSLQKYKKYNNLNECLTILLNNKALFEASLNRCKKIIENKGKLSD